MGSVGLCCGFLRKLHVLTHLLSLLRNHPGEEQQDHLYHKQETYPRQHRRPCAPIPDPLLRSSWISVTAVGGIVMVDVRM